MRTTVINNYLPTLVSNEAKISRATEVALSGSVDFLIVNIDSKEDRFDSLSELQSVNKVNATGSDVYNRLTTFKAVLHPWV